MRRSQVRRLVKQRGLQMPARYSQGQQFSAKQPLETHFRQATCEEVDCEAHIEGWVTILDPNNADHQPLFPALKKSGRHFTEMRSEDAAQLTGEVYPGGMRAFVFKPGQQCFEPHRVPVEREPFLIHRSATGRTMRHTTARNFTEHFNEEGYRVNRLLGKV